MKWQLQLKRRFATRFRPSLEVLERRDCPSCSVFQKGDTLFIVGDRDANQIGIADTREGDIAVICDGGDPHRFAGVQRIVVETFAGDDEITATFANPAEPVFHFRADLGAGADRLSIRGFDPQPDPPRQTVVFDIHAGAGNDEVAFELGHIHHSGQFLISADGGAGNDRLTFGVIVPCLLPESELSIDFNGNAGDDLLAARIGGPSETPAEIDGVLQVGLDGGDDDDSAILDVAHVDIHGALLAEVHGDRGADRLLSRISDEVEVYGRLDLSATGGAGNDIFNSFIVPCILPAGRGELAFDGDAGDDQFMMNVGDGDIAGEFMMSVAGGAGNDVFNSFIVPCLLPASRASFSFEGGEGNDRIAVEGQQDEDDAGALAVRVLGGAGDDNLTLALFDIPETLSLSALVDGGDGYDVVHLTRNVRFANCEEIEYLDGR